MRFRALIFMCKPLFMAPFSYSRFSILFSIFLTIIARQTKKKEISFKDNSVDISTPRIIFLFEFSMQSKKSVDEDSILAKVETKIEQSRKTSNILFGNKSNFSSLKNLTKWNLFYPKYSICSQGQKQILPHKFQPIMGEPEKILITKN